MSISSTPAQQPAAMPMPVDLWVATDRGVAREVNEDSIFPRPDASQGGQARSAAQLAARGIMAIVADGVGGAQVGSRVSERAVRYVSDGYYDGPSPDLIVNLREAVESANLWLYDLVRRDRSLTQAATTLTAAVIHHDTLFLAHVGDSRAYLVRRGTITQLTRDHTLAQEKVDAGQLRPEDKLKDPDRSRLTRWLVSSDPVRPDLRVEQLAPGDTVVLCSDGLYDMVTDEEVRQTVERYPARKATKRLIDLANRRGGEDNISVAVMRLPGASAAPVARDRSKVFLALLWSAVLILLLSLAAVAGAYLIGALPRSTDTPVAGTLSPAVTAAPGSTQTPVLAPVGGGVTLPPSSPGMPTSTAITPRTNTPVIVPSVPPPSRTPTPTRRRGGSGPSPTPPPPPAPVLLAPDPNIAAGGHQTFEWAWSGGSMPAGWAFDLLIWSEAEDASTDWANARRGVEKLQNGNSVVVNLDQVATIQEHGEGQYYWTVIVVRVSPYLRIGQWGEERPLTYDYVPPTRTPAPPPTQTPDPCAGFPKAQCGSRCCAGASDPLCPICCAGFTCPP